MFLKEKNGRREFALKLMCNSTHRPYTVAGDIQEVAEVLQQTSPEHRLPHVPSVAQRSWHLCFVGYRAGQGPRQHMGFELTKFLQLSTEEVAIGSHLHAVKGSCHIQYIRNH